MKTCTSCGEERPLDQFGKRSASEDGLAYKCKLCVSEYNKKYRDKHRTKLTEYSRQWHKDNPEYMRQYHVENREQKRVYYEKWKLDNRLKRSATEQKRRAARNQGGGSYTEEEWQGRLEEFSYLCAYCGAPWEHADHMIPVSKGGTSWVWNMVPACSSCNRSKRNRSLNEWRNGEFAWMIPTEDNVEDD